MFVYINQSNLIYQKISFVKSIIFVLVLFDIDIQKKERNVFKLSHLYVKTRNRFQDDFLVDSWAASSCPFITFASFKIPTGTFA